VYQSKSLDDEKICWTAYLGSDIFLKHCFTNTYDFQYKESDLKQSLYFWQIYAYVMEKPVNFLCMGK